MYATKGYRPLYGLAATDEQPFERFRGSLSPSVLNNMSLATKTLVTTQAQSQAIRDAAAGAGPLEYGDVQTPPYTTAEGAALVPWVTRIGAVFAGIAVAGLAGAVYMKARKR